VNPRRDNNFQECGSERASSRAAKNPLASGDAALEIREPPAGPASGGGGAIIQVY